MVNQQQMGNVLSEFDIQLLSQDCVSILKASLKLHKTLQTIKLIKMEKSLAQKFSS